ncbi:MAG: hypothetical protein CSA31_00810 [Desulfobulbus propionicus]|nr:MAG: hypothetical protein CSA31_00810 [Desulfobulbus propionicus]
MGCGFSALARISHEHFVSFEKKYIKIHICDISDQTQILPECSPGVSSGSTIFASILATHIPRYNALPETTEPGTT